MDIEFDRTSPNISSNVLSSYQKSSRRKQSKPNRVTSIAPDITTASSIEPGTHLSTDYILASQSASKEDYSLFNDSSDDPFEKVNEMVEGHPDAVVDEYGFLNDGVGCGFCGQNFHEQSALQEHIETAHLTLNPTNTIQDEGEEDEPQPLNLVTSNHNSQNRDTNDSTTFIPLTSDNLSSTTIPSVFSSTIAETNSNLDNNFSPPQYLTLNNNTKPSEGTGETMSTNLNPSTVESHTGSFYGKSLTAITSKSNIDVGEKNNKIFHRDAYCDVCNREFCNKYFLRTHKANKHGIYEDTGRGTSVSIANSDTLLTPFNKSSAQTNSNFSNNSILLTPVNSASSGGLDLSTLKKNTGGSGAENSESAANALVASIMKSIKASHPTSKLGNERNLSQSLAISGSSNHTHPKSSQFVSSILGQQQKAMLSLSSSSKTSPKSLDLSANSSSMSQLHTSNKNIFAAADSGSASDQLSRNKSLATSSGHSNLSPTVPDDYCQYCKKHFCNRYYLRKHLVDVHKLNLPPSNSRVGRPPNSSRDITQGKRQKQIAQMFANNGNLNSSPTSFSVGSGVAALKQPSESFANNTPSTETIKTSPNSSTTPLALNLDQVKKLSPMAAALSLLTANGDEASQDTFKDVSLSSFFDLNSFATALQKSSSDSAQFQALMMAMLAASKNSDDKQETSVDNTQTQFQDFFEKAAKITASTVKNEEKIVKDGPTTSFFKCNLCVKEFESEQFLKLHNITKHNPSTLSSPPEKGIHEVANISVNLSSMQEDKSLLSESINAATLPSTESISSGGAVGEKSGKDGVVPTTSSNSNSPSSQQTSPNTIVKPIRSSTDLLAETHIAKPDADSKKTSSVENTIESSKKCSMCGEVFLDSEVRRIHEFLSHGNISSGTEDENMSKLLWKNASALLPFVYEPASPDALALAQYAVQTQQLMSPQGMTSSSSGLRKLLSAYGNQLNEMQKLLNIKKETDTTSQDSLKNSLSYLNPSYNSVSFFQDMMKWAAGMSQTPFDTKLSEQIGKLGNNSLDTTANDSGDGIKLAEKAAMFETMVAAKMADRVMCDICNKQVCNKYFLKTHKQKIHGIVTSNDTSAENTIYNSILNDSQPPTKMQKLDNDSPRSFNGGGLGVEKDSTVSRPHSAFASTTNIHGNMSSENPTGKLVKCSDCGKDFPDAHFLKLHELTVHGIPSPVTQENKMSSLVNSTVASVFSTDQDNSNTILARALQYFPQIINSSASIGNGTSMTRVDCDVCCKSLCNKYFLRTHKLKKHGIRDESLISPGNSVADATSPLTEDESNHSSSAVITNIQKPTFVGNTKIDGKENWISSASKIDEVKGSSIMAPPEVTSTDLTSVESIARKDDHNVATTQKELPTGDDQLPVAAAETRYFSHFTEVCPLCDRRFKSVKWLQNHIRNDHIENDSFSNKKNSDAIQRTLMKRLLSVASPDFSQVNHQNNSESRRIFSSDILGKSSTASPPLYTAKVSSAAVSSSSIKKCYLCNFVTTSYVALCNHAIKYHRKMRKGLYLCKYCDCGFNYISSLKKHIFNSHRQHCNESVKQQILFKCTCHICRCTFNSLEQLNEHRFFEHKLPLVRKSKYGSSTSLSSRIVAKKISHGPKGVGFKRFTCKKCRISFSKYYLFKTHVIICSPNGDGSERDKSHLTSTTELEESLGQNRCMPETIQVTESMISLKSVLDSNSTKTPVISLNRCADSDDTVAPNELSSTSPTFNTASMSTVKFGHLTSSTPAGMENGAIEMASSL